MRNAISDAEHCSEHTAVRHLIDRQFQSTDQRVRAGQEAKELVESIRSGRNFSVMSSFLTEYGLNSEEGIQLMSLAEALFRVPDRHTIDLLIQDKIGVANWHQHLGQSDSLAVNAATRLLGLTSGILGIRERNWLPTPIGALVQHIARPVIRTAVTQTIRYSASQFVLGTTIQSAWNRGRKWMGRGYRYSFDMLGEAALTQHDADRYMNAYRQAIKFLATRCESEDIRKNPGISVKLSALTPRLQYSQSRLVLDSLVESVLQLTDLARSANIGLNIDAEEADKLDLTLDVIERVMSDDSLKSWDGFGVVVQAYRLNAVAVIDCLYGMAQALDRKIMVRLVKGAYWDTEIKHAQVLGLSAFPVFTRKCSTDVSYLACARRLLELNDRIYPQFATHNAQSICAIMSMIDEHHRYEFQRLHGMGEEVHQVGHDRYRYPLRIYAPVGAHEDLLAYLVRRILENGANSSFVHQIADSRVPVAEIVSDPLEVVGKLGDSIAHPSVLPPKQIFGLIRSNSSGIDLENRFELKRLCSRLADYKSATWQATSTADTVAAGRQQDPVHNPANLDELVGHVIQTPVDAVDRIIQNAECGFETWRQTSVEHRARAIKQLADAYESNTPELIALMIRETGKTIADAVSEVREAVDFCRYYADEAIRLESRREGKARGIFACISPWNFPLAIFTGQITAALAAGNAVIAKPAEQSALTAALAIGLMHQAGIPEDSVQLLPGYGETVGSALVADHRIAGICFTGSTETAQRIHRAMAKTGNPMAPLIAETGGINAMIVDSTALPEQTVRDITASAFQSCGQRCSALRVLYIQKDIETRFLDMLFGAMDELRIGDPWHVSTDVGPAIDDQAKLHLSGYCEDMTSAGRLLHQSPVPSGIKGYFVAPSAFRVAGIEDISREVFGPILHIATYHGRDLDRTIESINASGYGLTFGLHSRLNGRVEQVSQKVNVGNVYVNRNQIGAVVESQPFGGRGLSGTGPKAGGPHYVARMMSFGKVQEKELIGTEIQRTDLQSDLKQLADWQVAWRSTRDRIDQLRTALSGHPTLLEHVDRYDAAIQTLRILKGPTGESNQLHLEPRGVFICVGSPKHVIDALAAGNAVLFVHPDREFAAELKSRGIPVICTDHLPDTQTLELSEHLSGMAFENCPEELMRIFRIELAGRPGTIVSFITDQNAPWQFSVEKSICIDTTAAGGNAGLLLETAPDIP